MRVLLVDDEALALDRLRTFFENIEGVEVVGQAQDGDEALTEIARLTPDLVILDVQMPGKNGLRAAAELDIDPRPELVFVTAHEHYAPDAFDVDAADYLLKPVRFDRLRQAVDRARRRRAMRDQAARAGALEEEVATLRSNGSTGLDDNGFWVPERHGQRRVPIDSIDWIEAARDYVLLHTATRSYIHRISMTALEQLLDPAQLMRVHRSTFIRPALVRAVQRLGKGLIALEMEDGSVVQVGPSYAGIVLERLGLL